MQTEGAVLLGLRKIYKNLRRL